MGCDIHLYRESKQGGKWTPLDKWEPSEYEEGMLEVPFEGRFTARNYKLFGALADMVRSSHPFSFQPRGLPVDTCPEIRNESDEWGCDGHNHSYLYLHELEDLEQIIQTSMIHVVGANDREELRAFRESISSSSPDWNLLFPYCAATNRPGYVEFEVDVPADFYIGKSLREIIDSLRGVPGEFPRIVFWFDN